MALSPHRLDPALLFLLCALCHGSISFAFSGSLTGRWENVVGTASLVSSVTPGSPSVFSHGDTHLDLGNGDLLDVGIANQLAFSGSTFSKPVDGRESFPVGSLSIQNGTSFGNTEATGVTLRLIMTFDQSKSGSLPIELPMRLQSTANSQDRTSSADIVELVPPASNFTVELNGEAYQLLLGWTCVTPNAGFVQSNQLLTYEGETATFELRATLTAIPISWRTAGSYSGIVDRNASINANLGGRFALTTAISYSDTIFTAVVTNGTTTQQFMGRLFSSINGTALGHSIATSATGSIELSFQIDPSTGVLSGDIGSATSRATLRGIHSTWLQRNSATLPYIGVHIAAMFLDEGLKGDMTYPQGTGYFGGNISPAGSYSAGARFADNTVSTVSTSVGQDGSIPLHWPLYNSTGSAQGWTSTDANRMTGEITWFKRPEAPTSKGRSYKAGFPIHRLHVSGGKTRNYGPKEIPLSLPNHPRNAQYAISGLGSLADITGHFRLTVSTAIMQPRAPLKLLINRSQWKFTGTCRIGGQIGQVYGVFIDQLHSGVGHIQLPNNQHTSPSITSGSIEITDLTL